MSDQEEELIEELPPSPEGEQTPKAHSKFSASGSERWLECPASVSLSQTVPPAPSSRYADEGTRAHLCLEELMKLYLTPMSVRDTQRAMAALREEYGSEMYEHCFGAFREIKERYRTSAAGSELLSETRVDLSFVHEGMFGTVDAAVIEPFGRLQVIDFKYGAGVLVEVEGNSQLAYYALGLAHQLDYNFVDVEMVVIQPRAYSESGTTRSWVISIEELVAWTERFSEGVAAALSPSPPFKSGAHCRWCPAKIVCPEIGERALAKAGATVKRGRVKIPEVSERDLPRLPELLDAADQLEYWIASVRAFAHAQLEKGGTISGWKLVQRRATRRWNDAQGAAEEAAFLFGEAAFKLELLSPAQLEKAVAEGGKEFVAQHAQSISSGLTMVRESDNRERVTTTRPGDEFDAWEVELPSLPNGKTKPTTNTTTTRRKAATRKSAFDEFDVIDV